jgi:hypothetical protein
VIDFIDVAIEALFAMAPVNVEDPEIGDRKLGTEAINPF